MMKNIFTKPWGNKDVADFDKFVVWLRNSYDLHMSDAGYNFLFNQYQKGEPFHVMFWSPDRGNIFLRFGDGNVKNKIQYQISVDDVDDSKWFNFAEINDWAAENKEDFHVFCGIRQQFRDSIKN